MRNKPTGTVDYVMDRLVENLRCNRCGAVVLRSDIKEYPYQCMHCDEDLYEIEVHIGDRITDAELDELLLITDNLLSFE